MKKTDPAGALPADQLPTDDSAAVVPEQALPDPIVIADGEHPSHGGSYVRQPDGTAVKQEN